MGRLAIDLIELAVGLGCLAAAIGAWRAGSWFRAAAAILAVAGLAAIVHAVRSLVG